MVTEGAMKVQLQTRSTFMLYNVKCAPPGKKRLISVGKAYLDGRNINISGMLKFFIAGSHGCMLGWPGIFIVITG